MCVIVAVKLPRNKTTGLPEKDATWRLAKIRDRSYKPVYKIRRHTVADIGASQLFLIDNESDWTEGVSINPKDGTALFMVNSALNNYADKKDTKGSKSDSSAVLDNGKNIRKILKSHDVETAAKMIKEFKLDGNTLITDGKRLFLVESFLSTETKEKYKDVKGNKKFRDIVSHDEYSVIIKEIKNDYLVVKSNHGDLDKTAGYTEDDGDSYVSSNKRRDYAFNAVEEQVHTPLELIRVLSSLRTDKIDKNAFYRPIRLKGEAKSKDSDTEIFSTSVIQIDGSGTILLKPVECSIEKYNVNNLIGGKYLTNLVVLPEQSTLYEKFRTFYVDKYLHKTII